MTHAEKRQAFVNAMMQAQNSRIRRNAEIVAKTELDIEMDAAEGVLEAKLMVSKKFGIE